MSAPILSICIPTYNRAELLRLQLMSLSEQLCELGSEVELIVSDNCSSDHTKQVVESLQTNYPIRYNRNSENVGYLRNFLILTNELATGEFCWILGDDDMVVRGKIAKLLGILKSHPDIDYCLVNYFSKSVEERNRIIQEHSSMYTPKPTECRCTDFSERSVAAWEELLGIDSTDPVSVYTAIVCHVFRRSLWCENTTLLRIDGKLFSSFDSTFPHIKILANAMMGKPAFYLGDPCVLLALGSQEWIDNWWVVSAVYMGQAIDLYEERGVDKHLITRLRSEYLRVYVPFIPTLLLNPNLPGREYFSLWRFLLKYRSYPIHMISLLLHIVRVGIFVKFVLPTNAWMLRKFPKSVYQRLHSTATRMLRTLRIA